MQIKQQTIEVEKVVKVYESRFILELNAEEALYLKALTGKVYGSPEIKGRKICNEIYNKLSEYIKDSTGGNIYFADRKSGGLEAIS